MENALVRRDVRMLDEPLRAQARSLTTGAVLAVVAVAGCAIVAFVRPQDALGDAPIVMVRESGALYVRVGDTLHPALNLASARLIAGVAAKPEFIKESELRKAKRGALLGIPGAPAVIPEPLGAEESQWAVCDDGNGTTVIAGPTAVGAQSTVALVRSRSDHLTYLLYDGRRARVSLAEPAAVRALHLEDAEPLDVSPSVLEAIPEVPPITAPAIPSAGQRGPAALGGMAVGSVVRVDRADADEMYVVLGNGVQRVGRVAADIVRFGDSHGNTEIVTVPADAIGAIPSVQNLPVATFPDSVSAPVAAKVVCAQWRPADTVTVMAGAELPLAAGQSPVALAQADGLGSNPDAVLVPPGRCLFVDSTHRYLVTDTGVRFAVHDAESRAALGLPAEAVPAPWTILRLLAEGPELSRRAALVAHDGLAPDPGAVALPG